MRHGGMFALLAGLVGMVIGAALVSGSPGAAASAPAAAARTVAMKSGPATLTHAATVSRTAPVAPRPAVKRWYVIPRGANGCQLNVRMGPSTKFAVAARFTRCDRSASCWFQESSCGAGTEDAVAAGWYACRNQSGGTSSSNLWTVVVGPDNRPAYTAAGCGWTVLR